MTVGTSKDLQALRARVRGTVIGPKDPGYDEARAVWNGSIDRRPAAVVRCTGTADVVAALRFAREAGLVVAVRGGGHNVAGLGTCDDGLVIDLSPIRGVRVDPRARTATVGGGALWGDVDHETQAFGLAVPGGVMSTTGVGGFTLGGGFGWLSRRDGLACDSLFEADVVTAEGEVLRVSETENPDLLWGLRGGGGNFGIVTSFGFRLRALGPQVLCGMVFHLLEDAPEVLASFRDYLTEAPDEVFGIGVLRIAPPAPFIPEEFHGRHVVATAVFHAGPVEEGERLLAPVRRFGSPIADVVMPRPYTAFQSMLDPALAPGAQNYWKAEYLAGLEDKAIEVAVDHASRFTSPLSDMKLAYFGGAVARVPVDGTAFAHRMAPWLLNINSRWEDRADSDRHIAWTRGLWEGFQPFSTGGVYVNFVGDEGEERVRAAYPEATYRRLVALKDRYDPENVFRVNQNIKPSGARR